MKVEQQFSGKFWSGGQVY